MADVKENTDSVTGSLPVYQRATDQNAMKERLASLPEKLRLYVEDFGAMPDIPRRVLIERAQQAKALAEVVGDGFEVTYDPSSFFDGDREAAGYLFFAHLSLGESPDQMTLDARQPHLRGQLAAEMRRVAALYIGAAVALESRLPGEAEGGAA